MASWESTGIAGLDDALCGLRKGDNVVWQLDKVEDFTRFTTPFIEKSLQDGKDFVYMRFAQHPPLVQKQEGLTIYELDAKSGFESFSTQVHSIISKHGIGAFYVFDSLSELLDAWATDLMVGNFFKVTCPYLFELDTIAYFCVLRNHHSFQTIARIRETTQLLLDIYDFDGNIYVHPLKVWNRYSPTMFLPHLQKGQQFSPVVSSVDTGKLLTHISKTSSGGSARLLDNWDKLFLKAEESISKSTTQEQVKQVISELCRLTIGTEQRISELARSYFTLEDLMQIKSRLIGSGFIGGKAAGMLLAQKILMMDKDLNWQDYIEPHDSFYVGSDVFYSYVVENGWWKLLMRQKTKEGYFKLASQIRKNFLKGKFPAQIRERFQEMIEYFGQSPIIVRSSSLLEDSFGNAFAGKYESVFLVNQGSPDERYQAFENAVRQVYASTMSEDALAYRVHRGLDQHDEQMALLVQRVSGSYRNNCFFPDLAGVGISYNTFVWNSRLDPKAGMLRLVFGLGTRAVDRVKDDYPQTIPLDKPTLRPYAHREDAFKFSQRKVDVLDITENSLCSKTAADVINDNPEIKIEYIATPDIETDIRRKEMGIKNMGRAWQITFDKLLTDTKFTDIFTKALKSLEKSYEYPVDVEFTANIDAKGEFKVNIVQCRPLQTKGLKAGVSFPDNIPEQNTIFSSHGYTMGGNISQAVKRIIYIDSKEYVQLPESKKYSIARLVGKLNRLVEDREQTPVMLMGPGRWGTTTPSLGVPVNFAEINKTAVLVEMAYEDENLMPELSFGSHFFQDLVESDIFYVALYPQNENVTFNRQLLEQMPNSLADLIPDHGGFENVLRVCEFYDKPSQIISNILTQKVVCFLS